MSRVWKKFFFKVFKAIAFLVGAVALYIGLVAFFIYIIGMPTPIAIIVSAMSCIFVPAIVTLLYWTYQDSKHEVEQENKEILRSLKARF